MGTHCSLAQSVERMTVNHDVVSSSLTGAARKKARESVLFFNEVFRCTEREVSFGREVHCVREVRFAR